MELHDRKIYTEEQLVNEKGKWSIEYVSQF